MTSYMHNERLSVVDRKVGTVNPDTVRVVDRKVGEYRHRVVDRKIGESRHDESC